MVAVRKVRASGNGSNGRRQGPPCTAPSKTSMLHMFVFGGDCSSTIDDADWCKQSGYSWTPASLPADVRFRSNASINGFVGHAFAQLVTYTEYFALSISSTWKCRFQPEHSGYAALPSSKLQCSANTHPRLVSKLLRTRTMCTKETGTPVSLCGGVLPPSRTMGVSALPPLGELH